MLRQGLLKATCVYWVRMWDSYLSAGLWNINALSS